MHLRPFTSASTCSFVLHDHFLQTQGLEVTIRPGMTRGQLSQLISLLPTVSPVTPNYVNGSPYILEYIGAPFHNILHACTCSYT